MRTSARSRCASTRKLFRYSIARWSSSGRLEKSGVRLAGMEATASIEAGLEEWAVAHDALSKLCLKRAALDAEEGKWLLTAFRAATHAHFGFASFGEYVERLFGLGRRATEEKLRVATALEELPELEQALRSGSLNWSAVREVTRVAAPHTEREWIIAAHGKTAREVERMVSGLAPGDRPKDPRRPDRVRHVLRFEVGAETLATVREAMRLLQKRSEHRLNDDEALLSMAREVLGGPRDAGRASYQVVVTQCEDCGRGFQHANGEQIELDPAIVEMCRCDAQEVVLAPASAAGIGGIDVNAREIGESVECAAHVGAALWPVASDAEVGEASSTYRDVVGQAADVAHVGGADNGDASDADRNSAGDLVLARRSASESAQDIRQKAVAAGGGSGLRRPRATQDTPPAVRREVFFRDRGRCVVPGCRNATYVDLHHLDLRSEGGSDDPDNLVVLCGAHHGAVHRGRLRIDGRVGTGLRVRHADGTTYGFMPSPTLAEASARAFEALKSLGFPEKTAPVALERALAGASADASADSLLRSAIAHASRR